MRSMIAILIWVLTCLANSSLAYALEETFTRITRSGKPLSLGGFMSARKGCHGPKLPQVILTTPPKYGTVCSEIANIKVGRVYNDPPLYPECKGKPVRGVRVVYVPVPDFTGKDIVRFSVVYPNKYQLDRTVDVNVKGKEDFLLIERPSGATPELQKVGPLPRCVPLVS